MDANDDQIHEFELAFQILYSGGTRRFTIKELDTVMRALGHTLSENKLENMISEMDIAGKGSIGFPEFVSMISRKLNEMDYDDEYRGAFHAFDKDNNGYLSIAELTEVLIGLSLKLNEHEIKEIMRRADHDQDGQLSYNEFVYMMMTMSL
ncbi:putative calmodulin-3 [Scaptodrosophila lebanonensis]|uniref:Calmodulin-3 n=1 Tax=Drosophila lebanonensis TaxID=7225 RepID=A0A6J2UMR9_DROLE|nr:putative calmodulin-3 [Scaptodrosophila lebanonensis]